MEIGKCIKAARKLRKMTQAELAEKIGVATITIRQYESEKRNPTLGTLQRIADVLEVDINELLDAQKLLLAYANKANLTVEQRQMAKELLSTNKKTVTDKDSPVLKRGDKFQNGKLEVVDNNSVDQEGKLIGKEETEADPEAAAKAVAIELEHLSMLDGRLRFVKAYQEGRKVVATIEIDEDAMSLDELTSVLEAFNSVVVQGVSTESFAKAASELARIITEREQKEDTPDE